MRYKLGLSRRTAALLALAVAIVAAAFTASAAHRAVVAHRVSPAVAGHGHDYRFISAKPETKGSNIVFSCQLRPPSAYPSSSCYGPQQIWNAYSIKPLLDQGVNGRGRSITIIDAFGDPDIQANVDTLDGLFGVPGTTVNVVYPNGQPDYANADPNDVFGWQIETDLDVEWAHAIAPGATINLVVAKSDQDSDILSATKYVADRHLGDVLSQSYGENEACVSPVIFNKQSAAFAQMGARGMTVLASSGDFGSAQYSCDGSQKVLGVSSPAVDPGVTAVGGTSLAATPSTLSPHADNGAYVSESTWAEWNLFGDKTSTGGGFSTLVREPKYQQPVSSISGGTRGVPDVSYNAAIQGGVIVATDYGFFRVGGTSAGSPQWAGIVALAGQEAGQGIGPINPLLYRLGTGTAASTYFHDVTTGNNGVPAAFSESGFAIAGFNAGSGWDATTGLGSPIASALVPALAGTAGNGPKR